MSHPDRDTEIRLVPAHGDDIERLCALHNRSEAHDGVPRVMDVEELREEFDDDAVVLAADVRLAEIDGSLAGYAYALHLPSDVRLERSYLFGEVDPEFRGRGVGTTLMAWTIGRARAQLATSTNDLPKYIRVDSYDFIDSAQQLYAHMGFTPVRWFEELLRPLDSLPDEVRVDGVEIRPWPADRDEEIRLVNNESFGDHWGSAPTSDEKWVQQVRGFGSRTDLSAVAIDMATDRVIAFCLTHRYEADDALIGRRDAWISRLGTLAPWRGRGVASALIVDALQHFALAGLTHASIGVDGDNPSGAARLYRSLGFERRLMAITSEIQVS